MPDNFTVRHPLGSRRRWLETLLLLVASFLTAIVVFFLVTRPKHHSGAYVFGIIIPAFLAFFVQSWLSPETDSYLPWMSRIIVNLAYGRAEEEGIHYREWFMHHFVSWKAIARLEYWPDSDGRILLHLYSRQSPVVFLPDQTKHNAALTSSPGTVDFISQKLNETWPHKSTFLICFEKAPTQKPAILTAYLRRLGLRQRALANALLMVLFLFGSMLYFEFRFGLSDEAFLKIIEALLIAILALRAGMYFWQKYKMSAKNQRRKLQQF
ncbi:MAG TPA: hypothetical protein VJW20_06545 [Candidatus Angelobacter sp.]|nr:hypothetical protein [Candidatus Angelobacter sp.]